MHMQQKANTMFLLASVLVILMPAHHFLSITTPASHLNSTWPSAPSREYQSEDTYKTVSTTSTNGRFLPFFFSPLSFLAALTTAGAVKLGLLYSAVTYVLSIFFPTVGLGLVSGRALDSSSLQVPPSLTSYLGTWSGALEAYAPTMTSQGCQYRAVCESANFVNIRLPSLSNWLKQLSSTFFLNLSNPYSQAWVNGITSQNCAALYNATCPVSPFQSAMQTLTS